MLFVTFILFQKGLRLVIPWVIDISILTILATRRPVFT